MWPCFPRRVLLRRTFGTDHPADAGSTTNLSAGIIARLVSRSARKTLPHLPRGSDVPGDRYRADSQDSSRRCKPIAAALIGRSVASSPVRDTAFTHRRREVAELLRVNRKTVYQAAANGDIPGVRRFHTEPPPVLRTCPGAVASERTGSRTGRRAGADSVSAMSGRAFEVTFHGQLLRVAPSFCSRPRPLA